MQELNHTLEGLTVRFHFLFPSNCPNIINKPALATKMHHHLSYISFQYFAVLY